MVVQAFHVNYWDYIGWVDRFAAPAYTTLQKEIANRNNLRSIYTPQVVFNGKDSPRWGKSLEPAIPAQVGITLKQLGPDQYEAQVSSKLSSNWTAYWTVTEHGHSSKVKAGENSGETLNHDFVVRQFTQAGNYPSASTPQRLSFRSIAATPGHPRQINLVVADPQSGATLQALSLTCTG
jgi:hypothetical protein